MGPDLLDLHHQGAERVIGAYLLDTVEGPALFDCGPTTCLDRLKEALGELALELGDLRHLLLSHIHLDHAGAAGVLVREHPALQVHVSAVGAPHLVDPSRLEASARRLYGDTFDSLWGELAPVPEANIRIAGPEVVGLECFPAPGHASHHVCYLDSARHALCRRRGRCPDPARSRRPAADAAARLRPRSVVPHDRRDRTASTAAPRPDPLRDRRRPGAAPRRAPGPPGGLGGARRERCNGRGVQRVCSNRRERNRSPTWRSTSARCRSGSPTPGSMRYRERHDAT